MSAFKHTPGPWSVEDPLGPETLSVVAGGPEVYNWTHIAQVSAEGNVQEGDAPKKQAKANAHLISAAPDLLMTLRAMHVMLRGICYFVDIDPETTSLKVSGAGEPIEKLTISDLLRSADTAIAKAEAR